MLECWVERFTREQGKQGVNSVGRFAYPFARVADYVNHSFRIATATALDRLLSADRLAGKMGERIAAGNASFRGRAGEKLRRDYTAFVLKETDLTIHACEYGWCVFQTETARCGGRLAPDPAGRSPAVCLDCANFVVEPKHAPSAGSAISRSCRKRRF